MSVINVRLLFTLLGFLLSVDANCGTNDNRGCSEDQCVNACKDGWEEHNGHCYYLSASNNAKNWTAAEDFCQEQGGHLASMVDDTLKDHILEEMTKGGHDWIWLGGKVTEEKTTWKWVDCTPWNVTFWARGEPTMGHEECLTLVLNFPGYTHLNKRWNDKSCSYKGGFLCSKKICNGQDFVSKGYANCVFPFVYNGFTYHHPTTVDTNPPRSWCSINIQPGGRHERNKWVYTDSDTSTRGSRPCHFPFKYRGFDHYHCTDADYHTCWCGFNREHEAGSWGTC